MTIITIKEEYDCVNSIIEKLANELKEVDGFLVFQLWQI